jgi:mannose-6-phosphate isomerase
LGAGLVIAEIQQSSNTTYRLFDWNRVERDGRPRQLHIEESLDTIDYARGPVGPQQPQPTGRPGIERLVECDKFVLDRWRFNHPITGGGDNRFHILSVIDGEAMFQTTGPLHPFPVGATLLVPAACPGFTIAPAQNATVLDMYLP